jgi:hypothetical protein
MPEGLEKDLSPQDLADVIAHVAAQGPPPKQFPGNKPIAVAPAADGSLALLATNCRIYGKTLVLEDKFTNLGYWSSQDDRAEWTIEISKAGLYAVEMEYACADSSSGDRFVLEVQGGAIDDGKAGSGKRGDGHTDDGKTRESRAAESRLAGKVAGTGTWDDYRRLAIGRLELRAGPQTLTFQAEGQIRNSLIDLRALRLVPVK